MALTLFQASAKAGTLVEARLNDAALRIETGDDGGPSRVTLDGKVQTPIAGPSPPYDDATAEGFELREFGPGPIVAGHVSRYMILFQGERICGEILVSPWMAPYLQPAVDAIASLQRTNPGLELRHDPACGVVPFASIATKGWPLLAGSKETQVFTTINLAFGFRPSAN